MNPLLPQTHVYRPDPAPPALVSGVSALAKALAAASSTSGKLVVASSPYSNMDCTSNVILYKARAMPTRRPFYATIPRRRR